MLSLLLKEKKHSAGFVGFLQAVGVVIYCLLVAILFWKGNAWFGKMNHYWGPVFFLVLFSASALVCGLLVFAYPVYLFWDEKKSRESLKIVAFTAAWLVFFAALFMLLIYLAQYFA